MQDVVGTRWSVLGRNVTLYTPRDADDPYMTRVRTKWAPDSHAVLAMKLLEAGELFIDLGANIGTFCFPVAAVTGARVIAVEALSSNVKCLTAGAEINDVDAEIVYSAILDVVGTVKVRGTSAFGRVGGDDGDDVAAVTLDALMAKRKWPKVSLVKIDVEGCELKVLAGANKFFEKNPGCNIMFEANAALCYSNGYTPQSLLSFFEERGYHIHLITNDRLIKRTSKDFQENGVSDYIASPKALPAIEGYGNSDYSKEQRIAIGRRTMQMKENYRKSALGQMDLAPDWLKAGILAD